MSQPAFDFTEPQEPDPVDPTYSVRELAQAINGVLRSGFGDGVWVRGEIQGWSGHRPHAYFQLVEETAEGRASLDVAFFAGQRTRLRPLLQQHGLDLGDGLKVRVYGRLDFYPPSGRLSFKMSDVDPRYTLGELALERDQVVQRLIRTGLYDANRTRPLTVPPLRIGLVTSVDSAAWHDATTELQRSGFGFQLKVADVRVQGEGAVGMVAGAIRSLGCRHDLDVIVLIRGGGSRSDLATFDAEAVAVAIAESPLPVFTGIGHETDRSVADEVAHRAFKTPTACAAALVELTAEYLARAEVAWAGVTRGAQQGLGRQSVRLGALAHHARHRTVAAVERSEQRLVAQTAVLRGQFDRALLQADRRMAAAIASLGRSSRRHLDAGGRELDHVEARVRGLDPARALARGWSITRGPDGRVLRSADAVGPGDLLTTTLASGSVTSRVEATQEGREP